MEDDKRLLLAVAFSESKNQYSIDIPQGSSVAETAFVMSVVIKCLIRDGIIEKSTDVTDLINKYLTDSQFEEIKGDE